MKLLAQLFILSTLIKALVPAMDTSELAKLPLLFEHFEAHRASDRSMDFLDFLVLHYTDARHHQEDHSTHSQLPFGQHHHVNIILPVLNAPEAPPLPEPPRPSYIQYTVPETRSVFSAFLPSIWQPPRMV